MNFTWQGQSCGSTSRLLVHRGLHDDFVGPGGQRIAAMRPGPPLDPSTDTGAIVTRSSSTRSLTTSRSARASRPGWSPAASG